MDVWCVEAATSCGVSCSNVAPASQQKQTHPYRVWYFVSYADDPEGTAKQSTRGKHGDVQCLEVVEQRADLIVGAT
jgi:hypothetical protein